MCKKENNYKMPRGEKSLSRLKESFLYLSNSYHRLIMSISARKKLKPDISIADARESGGVLRGNYVNY